ncbi:hypothetical protein NGI46_07915 [Peribacillus butanolivorans]|uniref:hypothetical protein n=1 Tax=Peribacillus butanolivorans TaxID=421767 RepID=UPI00207C802D|nr:hypothetical protein [Peribacillus butanolivorans]MCO0597392.1 hypothetical protein [Peribacillus butanolivorans]
MIDYKTVLHEDITKLQAATKRGEFPRELRMEKVEELTESYYRLAGEMPDGVALERLTDLILHEELTDMNEHKVSQTEYPFLSEHQFDRRENKEVATGGDRMNMNAADGGKHEKPDRRQRNSYENLLIDRKARSRNKERRQKYNEFTKVQPVITWNFRENE